MQLLSDDDQDEEEDVDQDEEEDVDQDEEEDEEDAGVSGLESDADSSDNELSAGSSSGANTDDSDEYGMKSASYMQTHFILLITTIYRTT